MTSESLAYLKGPDAPPVLDMTVGDLLRRAVEMRPDGIALVEGIVGERRRWTYRELLRDAEALARALLTHYSPGDHVAIFAPNIPEYTVFQCAAALAGMVMVTINPTFRKAEVGYSLRQSKAVACFTVAEFRGSAMLEIVTSLRAELPALREVVDIAALAAFVASGAAERPLPVVDARSAAQIQYTSGTTGAPKGAMIPHRGIVNDPRQSAVRAGGKDGGVWLALLPMFHVGGCVLAGMGAMSLAGTLVVMNFEPGLALQLIEEERVTITNPVPTMVAAMMQHASFATRDLSSLRSLISGGAPVPADMVRQFEKALGVDFTIVFGQTESSGVITMTTIEDTAEDKATTCGRPLPGVEIKLVSPDTGETVRRGGELGELLTRGYHTMLGYHDAPDASKTTLEADGWMHTRDLCVMDERGYIAVRGRITDMIIRGGENIYPREIEDALFQHGALLTAVVLGLPDDYYGEIVGAFVRVKPDAVVTVAELTAFLRDRLSGYKVPAKWYRVEEYPQTLSGKIQKFRIRDSFVSGDFSGREWTDG